MRKTNSAVTSSSKRSTQFSPSRQRLLFALLTFSSLTSGGAALAAGGSLPTGGHFVGGAGAITSSGNHLAVNQSTQIGIINWQSFSIGKGDSVYIANGNGATLNRVTGGNISAIAGSLRSTGSVYVVNQAGVVVGPGGKVVTNGSFVASTRDVSNATFMAGGNIDLSGSSSGTVVNQGSITSNNGNVVLVGKSVSNSGSISAAKGNASLVAGDTVLLQASGDDAVLVETGSGDVTNTGTVEAAQVALNAAGGNVYALAVNDGGVIRATGTKTRDGHVYLSAGDDLTVNSSVSATNADGSGGTVVATGTNVKVGGKARISADGTTNGGTILIGGDRHGGSDPSVALSKTAVANAKTTTIAANARISAVGHGKGNGGNVVVWSDDTTTYAGKISAQGGWGGNGGFVEVSGKIGLAFSGRVNTMARNGKAGTLLLDPSDVTIVSSTDSGGTTTTTGESQTGGTFNPTTGTSFILNTDIDAALASNNVVISTGSLGDGLGGTGNISIGTNNGAAFLHSAPIHWNTSNSLTLNALGSILTPGGGPDSTTGGFSPDHPDVLIDSEHGGVINFNAGGNGATAGASVIELQGNILGSGGQINLVATNPGFRVEFNNMQGITNTAQFGAGKIVLQADEVRLGTGTGPQAFVRTPGEVDIVPTSPGAVVLGDNSASGDFSSTANTALIRDEDVVNISANLVVIGSTNTTSMTIETVNPTDHVGLFNGFTQFDAVLAHNLKLLTGTNGSVTQDANTQIIVDDNIGGTVDAINPTLTTGSGGLAVQTGGAITLNNAGNSVGSIAFKQTGAGGNISFTTVASANNTLVVGTVGDISGISTVGTRTVTIAASGDAVSQTAGAANVIAPASGSIALDLEGSNSSFALDNPANAIKTVAATVQSLSLHSNISLSTATIGSSSGLNATGDVTVVDNGLLTIASGAGITTTGGSVKLEDQTFTNSDAGSAFNVTGGGTWRVYSQNPTLDSDNGATLTYSFVQYNAANSYATPFTTADGVLTTSGATGNGFIYAVAPVLKETITGQFNKVYDGNTAVTGTLAAGNYSVTAGGINSDQITFTNPTGTGAGVATYADKNAANNIAISLTNPVTFTAKDSNNVQIFGYGLTVTNNLKGNITPLGVTLTGTRVYNGLTGAAGGILTVNGEISGDPTLTVTGTGTLASKNASSTPTNISALGTLALLGTGSGNYSITSGTVTVTPLDVTATGTRAYDGTTGASGTILGVVGEISGDPTLTVTGTGTLASKNASSTPTNISTLGTLALSGTGSGNYHLVSGTVTVTPLALTLTGTRVYDGTTGASSTILTANGEIGGDPALTVTGSGTLANKNASSTPTNISNLGSLALSGTGKGNYSIASGTVTVTPLDVTVTGTRAYNGNTGAAGTILTVNGELGGDPTLTVTGSGTLTSKNASSTPTNISTLGTLALSGTGNGNYHIVSGTVTVTPLALTLTGTRVYDGTTLASSTILSVNGEINGDPALTVTGSGTLANKNASSTPTNIANLGSLALSGAGSGNYSIASGKVTVTPLGVTVTGTRTYNGNTGASGTILTVNGELGGDPALTVTGSGTLANKNASSTPTNISSLGTLDLSGTGAGNYNIVSGTVTVTPLDVTVTGTRAYDGTTGASGTILTVTGLINGDPALTVTGSGTLANKNASSTPTNISTLGTLDLSGTGNGNYHIVSGTVTVTPKIVTVIGTRGYDGTTGASGTILTVNGEINGDPTLTVTGSGTLANKNASTTPTNIANLGTLGLSGTGNGNYAIGSGKVTVTPINLVITPDAFTRAFDGSTTDKTAYSDAAGNYMIVGLQNGETVGSSGSALFLTGSMLFGGSSSTVLRNAGTYSQGAGTLALGGSGAGNYNLVFSNPHPNNYVITPMAVTIVGFNGTRVYDGMTDANSSILTLTSIKGNDQVTITGTGILASKNVGKETITGIGTLALGGANAGNYEIVVGRPDTYVTVTPATLTVSAVTQTKVFDGTVTSTGTPTLVGLQTGDSITGALEQAYGSKNVLGTNGSTLSATHDIGVSDGNGGANYVIVYKTAKGTITPENITISALTQTKVYDGTTTSTETPTMTAGMLYNGDTLTGLSQLYNSKNVMGTNGSTLTVGSGYTLTNAGNYNVIVKTAKGTITPLTVDITGTRVYNGTPGIDGPGLTVTGLPGDDLGLTGTGTLDGPHVGTHTISDPGTLTLTGGDSGNYTLTGGTSRVTVTPYAVILTGTRVYDGDTDGNSGILSVTNAFAGDTVTVDTGTSTIVSRNVGNEKITNFGTLTLGGSSSGDYTLVGAKGNVIVTPETLVVTAVPGTKTYDGTTTSTGTPIVTTGTVFGPDTGNFTQTYGNPHAGTGLTLTPSGTVNDGNGGNNYIVTYVPITSGVIDPLPVIMTGTRPFDGQTDANSPILTITNLIPGDVVTVGGTGVVGSPNVGLEPITGFGGLTLGGTSSGDYTLVGAIGTVNITPGGSPVIQIPNTQTASGNGTNQNFNVTDSGIISLTPRQNGVVTGTIATIDGTDYQPDSQLGCTLGEAGCIQNGVAPTTTSTPPQ